MKPAANAKGGASSFAGNKDASANDSFNKHYNKELKVSEGRPTFTVCDLDLTLSVLVTI